MDNLRLYYNPTIARARLEAANRRVPQERRTAMQFREFEEHPYLGTRVPTNRTDHYRTVPVSWAELPPFVREIGRRRGIYGFILSSMSPLTDAEIQHIKELYYGS